MSSSAARRPAHIARRGYSPARLLPLRMQVRNHLPRPFGLWERDASLCGVGPRLCVDALAFSGWMIQGRHYIVTPYAQLIWGLVQ
jgi:hypothetical protein